MCKLLYEQNKYNDSEKLIELVKIDCKNMQDTFFLRSLEEIRAKILIKRGKFNEGDEIFQTVIKMDKFNNKDYGKLLGDYGELMFERGNFDISMKLFEESMKVFNNILILHSYDPQPSNYNQKAVFDNVKISDKYKLTNEMEQEILKKIDRIKVGKRDDKKNENRKKENKKGNNQVEKFEMKVNPLNPHNPQDFSKESKILYSKVEVEHQNSLQCGVNSYIKIVELFVKACLR